jgi:hypothetical protein
MFILNKENLEKLVLENDIQKTISTLMEIEPELDENKTVDLFQHMIDVAVKNSCLKPLQAFVAYYENNSELFTQFQEVVGQKISEHENFEIVEKCLLSKITSVKAILKAASEQNDTHLLNFILHHEYIAVLTPEQKSLSLDIYLSNDINTISYIENIIPKQDFNSDDLKRLINHCFINQNAESLKYLEKNHHLDMNLFMKESIAESQLTNLTFSLAFATSVNTFYQEKAEKQVNFMEYLLEKGANKNLVYQMYFKGLTNQNGSMELFNTLYNALEKKGLINEEQLKELVSDKKLQPYLDYKNALNEKNQLEDNVSEIKENKTGFKL